MQIQTKQKNNGFTLVELMVATSIFVIIMLAAMSSLFIMLDAAKNSKALRLAMDNVNFAMESMTRSIRMGTNYHCLPADSTIPDESIVENGGKDCKGGGPLLAFISQPQEGKTEGSLVGYLLKDDNVQGGNKTLLRCTSSYSNDCVEITSSDVNVERLKFFVRGSEDPDDKTQPSVYIIMEGTVMVKGVPTSFAIQTLASQRNF